MKKLLIIIILITLAAAGALVVTKNMIAKTALSAGIKASTGLTIDMKSVEVGILETFIGIKELKLQNPPGFPDPVMIDMPELYINYDLGALFNKEVHLEKLKLNLKKFIIVRNKEGQLNLDSFKMKKSGKEEKVSPEMRKGEERDKKTKVPKLRIDVLELKINKVVFKDYFRRKEPKISEFSLNMDEQYENITDPSTLAGLIVAGALLENTISRFTNFNLSPLKNRSTDLSSKATESGREMGKNAKEAIKESLDGAADKLREMLPFRR